MHVTEMALMLIWFGGCLFVLIGVITNHPKLQIDQLFTVSNRWGKLLFSIVVLTMIIIRVVQWQASSNPSFIW